MAILRAPVLQNRRQVDNKPAAVVVTDALRSAILNGEVVGGHRVRQDHIATEFGVSFHEALYAPARRDRTLGLINGLRLNFERYLRFAWDKTPDRGRSQKEHREILLNCREKKVDKACGLLRRLLATGKLLVKALQKYRH